MLITLKGHNGLLCMRVRIAFKQIKHTGKAEAESKRRITWTNSNPPGLWFFNLLIPH